MYCLLISALVSLIPPSVRRETKDYTRVSSQVGLSKDEVSKYRVGRRMSSFLSAIKKVSLNTVSSAAGTATVLGVHSAFVPSGVWRLRSGRGSILTWTRDAY